MTDLVNRASYNSTSSLKRLATRIACAHEPQLTPLQVYYRK